MTKTQVKKLETLAAAANKGVDIVKEAQKTSGVVEGSHVRLLELQAQRKTLNKEIDTIQKLLAARKPAVGDKVAFTSGKNVGLKAVVVWLGARSCKVQIEGKNFLSGAAYGELDKLV